MTVCNQSTFDFQNLGFKKITADFSGGFLSSDAGALFLREVILRTRIFNQLADCFIDSRNQRFVEHSVVELLQQRIAGICLGYEDLIDHDRLRYDPLIALLSGKKDITGTQRHLTSDKGKALASHSTLNRLELGCEHTDERYKKIAAQPEQIEALLMREGVKAIPRKTRRIVLDFDASDDPLHGAQEGSFFHGYYKQYCYLPLYCFCGNIPLWAQLRPSDIDASAGTVDALKKIVPVIRKRFGKKVEIILRADSAFAREEIMAWCEENNVYYCLGLARNERLSPHLNKAFETLEAQHKSGTLELPARQFEEFEY